MRLVFDKCPYMKLGITGIPLKDAFCVGSGDAKEAAKVAFSRRRTKRGWREGQSPGLHWLAGPIPMADSHFLCIFIRLPAHISASWQSQTVTEQQDFLGLARRGRNCCLFLERLSVLSQFSLSSQRTSFSPK
jgi:hypothetical protein